MEDASAEASLPIATNPNAALFVQYMLEKKTNALVAMEGWLLSAPMSP